jgi:D-arabinose 1-dehydrogenase-like Zn-dependent alcohol dehydrogenase
MGGKATSYAVVEHGGPLARVDGEIPKPAGTEVVLEVSHCGLCHTDLHLWDGFYDLGGGRRLRMADRGVAPPFVPGHEIAGEVIAVGPQAEGVGPGQKRVVYPWIGCGLCSNCERDQEHLCLAPRALGIFRPGGFASHILVPHSRYLFEIGGLPDALAPTLACSGLTAFSALSKVLPLPKGGRLALIGAGGLGLAALQLSRAMGAAAPIVVDISDERLETARRLAAVDTVDAGAPDAASRLRNSAGNNLLAVIDFVGSSTSVQLGLDALQRGGFLVLVGLFGGEIALPLPALALRALKIEGSYVGSLAEFRALLDLVRSGAVDSIPLNERPLEAVNDALHDLRAGRVTGRILLRP